MPQNTAMHSTRNDANLYLRCLRGQVPVPTCGRERFLFQCIMVFFMVSCMVTFNWLLRQSDPTFAAFGEMLYEYPLTFAIALTVRTLIANPLVGRIVPHIPSSLAGVRRTLAMTAVNVCVMATIMTFFGTLISTGFAGFTVIEFATSVPTSIVMAFALNFLVVGPLTKVVYTRAIKPGLSALAEKASSIRSAIAARMPVLSGSGK